MFTILVYRVARLTLTFAHYFCRYLVINQNIGQIKSDGGGGGKVG